MTKEKAIELASVMAPAFPGVKMFFVTDDDQVFTKATDAVTQAVKLSAGNPQVMEVKEDELVVDPNVEKPKDKKEDIADDKDVVSEKDQLVKKIADMKFEISARDNDDEIEEHNYDEKLHVADLKEKLAAAEERLKELEPEL